MAVDKLVDSAQLDADLTSVANAIRTKGGTSAQLAFPADFVQAIEAISGGGGDNPYLTAEYTATSKNVPHIYTDYRFRPKYKTELILWVQNAGQTGYGGNASNIGYALWLVDGAFPSRNYSFTFASAQPSWTAPVSGSIRNDGTAWYIDEDGYLANTTASTDSYYFVSAGKTIKLYEFPIDPTEVT